MIKALEEYLERRGAKYFITMLMFSYVLGTLIFTIYLGALGISDFEFLQLRYMFVGILFTIITALFLLPTFWGLKKIFSKFKGRVLEFTFGVILVVWTPIYALKIFPQIPSNFGGARPVLARFIGNTDKIREINEIIEYETGAKDLPLEIFPKNKDLAKGANVKILDRNKDRIWIILTRDLYLSSRSKLAKDLIESGASLDHENNFIAKPLLVDAEGIKNISFSLYEPPETLTKADIDIIKANPNLSKTSTKVVKKFINKVSPIKATEVLDVIKKDDEQAISKIIEATVEDKFFAFRKEFFGKGITLSDVERSRGIDENARLNFVLDLVGSLQKLFPKRALLIKDLPYLTLGIKEEKYISKIIKALQGVPNVEDFIKRIKAISPDSVGEIPDEVLPTEDILESGSGSVMK